MNGHHLILGETKDCITGETIPLTHDEEFRQKIAELLLNDLGYSKNNIIPRQQLTVTAGKKRAIVPVDFIVTIDNCHLMIIRYGPGSIVTRRKPAIAVSMLLGKHQIPIAVVTNGRDAEIIDTESGLIIGRGLTEIPSKEKLKQISTGKTPKSIPASKIEMASRLVYVYEVDGACPCDDTIRRLD